MGALLLAGTVCASAAEPVGPVQEARGFLSRLVGVDTSAPAGNEAEILKETARFLQDNGIYATFHASAPGRGNLVARLAADKPTLTPLLLVAGMDVTPCSARTFSTAIFSVTERNAELLGCGVAHPKGVAAAMVEAVLSLKRSGAALSRDVFLILTADGMANGDAGLKHLFTVLPSLAKDGVVLMPGGANIQAADGKVLLLGVQHEAKEAMRIQLKAYGDALGPAGTSTESALGHALRAAGHVEEHRFPIHPSEPLKTEISGVMAILGDRVDANSPRLDAINHTTCKVTHLPVLPLPWHSPSPLSLEVQCFLAPPDEPSNIAWQMVDIVKKDPRVVVERLKDPKTPAHALDPQVMAALGTAAQDAFAAPTAPWRGNPAPQAQWLRSQGLDVYELGVFPLTDAQWAASHGHDERLGTRAFEQGTTFLIRAVALLAAAP